MDSSQITTNLVIIVITFMFAAFFVAAEFALVQTRPSQLEDLIDSGSGNQRKLNRALKMVKRLNEYLSTTQVGVSLTGIILGWIGESTIETLLVQLLGWTHLASGSSLNAIGAVVGIILLTYLEVVLTEIVPKNISIDIPVKTLMFVVTPLHIFHTIFYPFVWLLNVSATGIVKLIGFAPADEENEVFSQSEILHLSKMSISGGDMDREDVVYMERAFELNDRTAKDIMTDRTRLNVIDVTENIGTALNMYLNDGFSRIPVVRDNDKDDMLGYIYIYDIIEQSRHDENVKVNRVIRALMTVPESLGIQDILHLMIKKQTPIVLVVDEYGGTSGVVTDKDIYEELFGTIQDEIDDVSDEYIIKDKTGVIKVSGKTTLYDFERYFRVKLPSFQNSSIITIGGFMMEQHPNLKVDDKINFDGFEFKLSEIEQGFMQWFEVKHLVPELTKPVVNNQAKSDVKDDAKKDETDAAEK